MAKRKKSRRSAHLGDLGCPCAMGGLGMDMPGGMALPLVGAVAVGAMLLLKGKKAEAAPMPAPAPAPSSALPPAVQAAQAVLNPGAAATAPAQVTTFNPNTMATSGWLKAYPVPSAAKGFNTTTDQGKILFIKNISQAERTALIGGPTTALGAKLRAFGTLKDADYLSMWNLRSSRIKASR